MLLFDEFPFFLALIPNFRQMILINYQQWCKVDHTSWLHFFDYMQFSFQFICGEEDYITNHDVGTRNSNEDYSTYPSPLSVRTDCLQFRYQIGYVRFCALQLLGVTQVIIVNHGRFLVVAQQHIAYFTYNF